VVVVAVVVLVVVVVAVVVVVVVVVVVKPFRNIKSHYEDYLDHRKLIGKDLNDFYSSPNIIRMIKMWRMECAWSVARMGEQREAYRMYGGKPDGKKPL
jgi:hypothetical protein